MRRLSFLKKTFPLLTGLLAALGGLFLVLLALAFTSVPFHLYHKLGSSKAGVSTAPHTIVLLGGGGMPSQSNLMRLWYTNLAAKQFPGANIILSLPGDTLIPESAICQMRRELIALGTDTLRIKFEPNGANTRAQALECSKLAVVGFPNKPVLLVSSPEHIYRAVLAFEKAGFKHIDALPAFEQALDGNLLFDENQLGGRKTPLPKVGENINLRYRFWTHLHYEVLLLREYAALFYYWAQGWV